MNSFAAFMHHGGWALFALIATAFTAGFYLVNQYLKQPGDILVFLMRLVVVVIVTPFMAQTAMPHNSLFYWLVAITAVLGVGADIRTLNVTAQYGAGVVSRLMPVTVWLSFLLWLVIKPEMLAAYASQPVKATGIVIAVLLAVGCAMRLRHDSISRQAMRAMAPALMAYVVCIVLNKSAMEQGTVQGGFFAAALAYIYVQSVLAIFLIGPYVLWRRRGLSLRVTWMTTIAALMTGFLWISHMIYKNFAVAYSSHPSYQSAIGLIAPFMIALFYRFVRHREDNTDMAAGIGIVLSAILLTIFTL